MFKVETIKDGTVSSETHSIIHSMALLGQCRHMVEAVLTGVREPFIIRIKLLLMEIW